MNQFPATLRGLRKRARMTQPELAEKLGVSRSAVSMYECGTREPNFAILEALSRIFDVDMNTLTGTPTGLVPLIASSACPSCSRRGRCREPRRRGRH